VTANGRILAFGIAGISIAGGLALTWVDGAGWGAIALGVTILLGTAFDTAYRGRPHQHSNAASHWQDTGEREIDSATGQIVVVWYDPVTGMRAYEPVGQTPS
jgi:hypothetical protein